MSKHDRYMTNAKFVHLQIQMAAGGLNSAKKEDRCQIRVLGGWELSRDGGAWLGRVGSGQPAKWRAAGPEGPAVTSA